MTNGDVLIRARDLALGYGPDPVVRGVHLEIRAGEYWFLVGLNGTGKTTFVRSLFDLVPPAGGTLWIDPERAGRERVGFVPQRCALNPSLPTTVRELVVLGLVGLTLSTAERKDRLATALAEVGLGGREHHDYWSLSGGQRQRVLLARALVRRPNVLVLDEPETGLDPAAEERLLDLLAQINRERGVTLLSVSHDLENVRRYASHVALFRDGTIHAGPVAEVLTHANLERTYGVPFGESSPSGGSAKPFGESSKPFGESSKPFGESSKPFGGSSPGGRS
ncbi:MAG: metal ABC transporter ATP-binding protein [Candidatus Binatia bacterium]